EVDVELGLTRVVWIGTAQDVGKAVNPQAVTGQIEGGTAQGLGLALMEEIQTRDGLITNASFTDYLIPTTLDMPPVVSELVEEAGVGAHIGAELIGGSIYELEPGDRLFPYHAHHANEEWVIVWRGQPTLRTPEGERTLSEGDVVCFPRGKEGAHQIRNDTDSPIRVLMVSTLIAPDIVEYLDTG